LRRYVIGMREVWLDSDFATCVATSSRQTHQTNLTTICRAIVIPLTHHAQEPMIGILILIEASIRTQSR
jgi:hypothetical protein